MSSQCHLQKIYMILRGLYSLKSRLDQDLVVLVPIMIHILSFILLDTRVVGTRPNVTLCQFLQQEKLGDTYSLLMLGRGKDR